VAPSAEASREVFSVEIEFTKHILESGLDLRIKGKLEKSLLKCGGGGDYKTWELDASLNEIMHTGL